MITNHKKENILSVTKTDQYRTIDELLKESRPTVVYYTLLVLSSIIVACGLLLSNSAIVIGGMLVTPVLTPVLVVALAVSAGETRPLKQVGILLGKSFLIIVVGSLLLSIILGLPIDSSIFENSIRTAVLYFIVAIVSGVAATFAWVRKEVAEVLPGIAIAVSLVPPLSSVGVWLSALEFETARFYFLVFVFNLLGIIMGSLVVFSLLKFYRMKRELEKKSNDASA